MLHIDWEILVK